MLACEQDKKWYSTKKSYMIGEGVGLGRAQTPARAEEFQERQPYDPKKQLGGTEAGMCGPPSELSLLH